LSGVIEERLGVEYIFGDLVNSYSLAECECHDVYSVVPSNDSFTSNMIPSMAWIISVMNVAGGPLLNGALGRVFQSTRSHVLPKYYAFIKRVL